MSLLLENKIIIVTGAGAGIGQGTAAVLAREGATVIVSDINLAHAEETAQQIIAAGGKSAALKTDVSNPQDVAELVQFAVQQYGKLYQLNLPYSNTAGWMVHSTMQVSPDQLLPWQNTTTRTLTK